MAGFPVTYQAQRQKRHAGDTGMLANLSDKNETIENRNYLQLLSTLVE